MHNRTEAVRELKNWYRQHGVCYICGQENAVHGGMCAACLERNLERVRKWREKNISAGLCIKCGKCAPELGKKTCENCNKRAKERYLIEREKKRIGPGKCKWCERERVPGYYFCETHLERIRQYAETARGKRRKWRKEAEP